MAVAAEGIFEWGEQANLRGHLNRGDPLWEPRGPIFLTWPISTSGILGVMLLLAFSTQFSVGPFQDFWWGVGEQNDMFALQLHGWGGQLPLLPPPPLPPPLRHRVKQETQIFLLTIEAVCVFFFHFISICSSLYFIFCLRSSFSVGTFLMYAGPERELLARYRRH